MSRWELVDQITKNLGKDWQVEGAGPQKLGHFVGLASGPSGMRLFFIARSQKLDPCIERSCPPLGWLRIDGRFPSSSGPEKTFEDGSYRPEPEPQISISLPESLTAKQIARELSVRFLPLYEGFLSLVKKHNLVLDEDQTVRQLGACDRSLPSPGQLRLNTQDAKVRAMPTLKLRPVSPFESMPDVRFSFFVAVALGIGAFALDGALRWTMAVILGLALLFICSRLSARLFPKYARLSYPLGVRYASLLGLRAGQLERDGKPTVIDEEFVCRFLTNAVYLNLDLATASELLHEAQTKAINFVDRDELLQEFVRRHPGLDVARFGPELEQRVRSAAETSPIRGYVYEWLMADVIERRHGKAQRLRYLANVVTGKVSF